VTGSDASTALAQSPSRIGPTSPQRRVHADITGDDQDRAVQRQLQAAQFAWHGRSLFVINNHLEDGADFGRYQPPVRWSEIQRVQQT
jgi:hypothetical protein